MMVVGQQGSDRQEELAAATAKKNWRPGPVHAKMLPPPDLRQLPGLGQTGHALLQRLPQALHASTRVRAARLDRCLPTAPPLAVEGYHALELGGRLGRSQPRGAVSLVDGHDVCNLCDAALDNLQLVSPDRRRNLQPASRTESVGSGAWLHGGMQS